MIKYLKKWLVLLLLSCCTGQAARAASNTMVLVYEDFGPQIVAHELIGPQNWQWDSAQDGNPDSSLDIKVIVYRGVSLEQVKSQFPVSADIKQDFRYEEYSKAISFLNYHITKNVLPIVTDGLRQTRDKIVAALEK